MAKAMTYDPAACFVGMSGGDDSLVATHWMMNNVPGCRVFHANTGIGIERTRQFVRDTCKENSWPLIEIRAKEDCGQDYEQIVLENGFPGPPSHFRMYQRLKERCVRLLLKRHKRRYHDCILIASGMRKDESVRRMRYSGREINKVDGQMWVMPLYYWSKDRFHQYIKDHNLKRNPVSEILGFSGECLCGAYAHPGEKELVRIVDRKTAEYLDDLEIRVRAAGHDWGWEDRKPRKAKPRNDTTPFMPFCIGCTKTDLK